MKEPTIGYMERGSGNMSELEAEKHMMCRDLALKEKNGTVARCARHGILFNPKSVDHCPLCIPAHEEKLAAEKRPARGNIRRICRHCGRGTVFLNNACSHYQCRRKEGLDAQGRPRKVFFQCRFCGVKTKESDRTCTKYECRKKGGKIYMYKQ